MRLIADGVVDREGVPGLASRLAVRTRHLNRVLTEAVGAPPVALARSQRAYQARMLVESTTMPFGEIAPIPVTTTRRPPAGRFGIEGGMTGQFTSPGPSRSRAPLRGGAAG